MTTFGLQLPNFTFPGVPDDQLFEHVADLTTTAEAAGFSSVWVMDHFWQLPPLGGPTQPILECYTLLSALAARTSRVELGALVTGVTYRNPTVVAQMVTTIDVISRGRAVLGIGAAWYEEEHAGLGFDFPPVRERMDRLEEAVQICRLMFTEESPSFDGQHYHIDGALNLPRPIRPGGPPILVGGSGEKRTLKVVAQHADRCNIHGSPPEVRRLLGVLDRHCADVGRDPTEILRTRRGSLMLTETEEAAEGLSSMLREAAGAEFDEQFTIGTEDQIVAQCAALIDAGVDELIFDMAYAPVENVDRVGKLLTSTFG